MKSNAAIWAGSGAPPPLTAGDTAAMAAPRGHMDASLNPGGGPVESTNTTDLAASVAAASAKPEAGAKAAVPGGAAKEAAAKPVVAAKK